MPGLHRVVSAVLVLAIVPSLWAAPADVAPPDLKPAGLDTVLDRIAVHAAGDRWQQDGWRDAVLEGWLDDLLTEVRAATGDQTLALPVRFEQLAPQVVAAAPRAGAVGADAKVTREGGAKAPAPATAPQTAVAPVQRGPVVMAQNPAGNVVVLRGAANIATKKVIVGRDVKVPHAMNSIILADGNAQVSFARHSIIIARGAVYVAHGENNVIVAGQFIHVSHDGSATMARNPNGGGRIALGANGQPLREVNRPGSLLISGGTLDVSHASGSTCVAKESLVISHATACAFVNPPANVKISNRTDCRDVVANGLRIDLPERGAAPRVRVDWMAAGRGAILRSDDRRYIADLGKPITDDSGKEVADMAGWTVTFCDQDYVLLTKGREDFVFPGPGPTD